MVSEDIVKDTLTKWLRHFNNEVLWEKKNKYGYPIFKPFFKGNARKPDLIVLRNGKSYVIEVKNADNPSGIVLDAINQIVGYAKEKQIFFYNNKKIIIDGYLIATQFSLLGHLFSSEYDSCYHPNKAYKMWAIQHGVIPANEFPATKLITRILWRNADAHDLKVMVGVLLSNVLNDSNSCAPLIFFKEDKNQNWDVWL